MKGRKPIADLTARVYSLEVDNEKTKAMLFQVTNDVKEVTDACCSLVDDVDKLEAKVDALEVSLSGGLVPRPKGPLFRFFRKVFRKSGTSGLQ